MAIFIKISKKGPLAVRQLQEYLMAPLIRHCRIGNAIHL